MRVRDWVCVAVLASAPLAGCDARLNSEHWFEGLYAHYPLPGPLHNGRCGADAHTESYPLAHEQRREYGCKSNDAGYLETEGQGDKRRN